MTPKPPTPTTPFSSANRKRASRPMLVGVCVLRCVFALFVLFMFAFCTRSHTLVLEYHDSYTRRLSWLARTSALSLLKLALLRTHSRTNIFWSRWHVRDELRYMLALWLRNGSCSSSNPASRNARGDLLRSRSAAAAGDGSACGSGAGVNRRPTKE